MYNDPHDTQAQHNADVDAMAFMDDTAATFASTGPALSPLRDTTPFISANDGTQVEYPTAAATVAAISATRAATDPRQLLIARARQAGTIYTTAERRAYLAEVSIHDYTGDNDNVIEGAFTGQLRNLVASLADALEREINRNA
jgi:hypothetical protein